MAADLVNLCRFLFDETGLNSSSTALFSQRIRSDDSIKRGLNYFYLLLRSGMAPIGGDDDSSSKLRFETWSDSQLRALVSISQAILVLSRSLLGTYSVDQVEPIVLGVIQEVKEFSLSFLEKSNFTQNDLKMKINMEMLLEIASFDASEKQYDILPPVSPAEAANLWPTFSDNMELQGGRCSNEEKPVVQTHSVGKPSFQEDYGNLSDSTSRLLVLYASQTGNALDAAERIGREAERRGCAASVISTDEFDVSFLPHEEAVVFVVSTTGQGDPPDSFKAFWKFLLQRNLGNSWLQRVRFAVFGLGDSGYQKYNFVAKKLDKRLLDLGATSIIEKGLGDDQHPSGYEGTLDPWVLSLLSTLYQINPKYFLRGLDVMIPQDKLIDQPKYTILYHNRKTLEPKLIIDSDIIHRARAMSPGKLSKDKSKPDCFLKLTRNEVLTKAGSTKDVRHFEFQFVSSIIPYEVGDVVEILPRQNPSAVDAFIERCGLDPESVITVNPRETKNSGSCGELITHVPIKLKTFVELTMDLTSASPRRYFFEVMSFYATDEREKEKLQYFVSPEGRDDLYNYNQKARKNVLEVLIDFPSVQLPFEWLVQLVPPLKPRAFSISSSPLAHPAQVHLTVSVVSWNRPFNRTRNGLCSSWLASLTPEQDINIPVWFRKGSLPAPPPSLPLILVGPGTGCAPFRGFIAERAVQAQTSPVAPVMFFFGCRNKDTDFLYRDFWESHAQGGILSEEKGGGFYTAFSRDQPKKVYVQHKIREMSKKVWDLLSDGAAVYVAGSSTKMPCDVMSVLEEVVSEETGESKEIASRWLKALEKSGRYHVEAWS